MTALKPYLTRSAAVHAAALLAFAFLIRNGVPKADKVYMIDFVGPSASVVSAGPASSASRTPEAASSKTGPQTDQDSISTAKKGPAVLPRPSLLKGWKESATATPPKPSLGNGQASSATGGEPSATPGASAGVATDLPNFPYPWYISQVRLMLWQAWQKKMPRVAGEGVVSFAILRNGAYTDLRMESSGGDSEFDEAALASVQAAAPFPALPSDFAEPFLKIHLTLKSEN